MIWSRFKDGGVHLRRLGKYQGIIYEISTKLSSSSVRVSLYQEHKRTKLLAVIPHDHHLYFYPKKRTKLLAIWLFDDVIRF